MLISELSIHRPIFATVLSLMLLVVGLIGLTRLWQGIRELPNIDSPVVSVETRYRGAAPEIIETKVTQPLEDRIAGVEHIDKLKSSSSDERSQISVEFDLDRNIDEAANDIRDRVGRVLSSLPEEADPPEISKADANAEPIIFVNLSSDTLGSLELTDYAERYVVDRFAAIPGVARVRLTGDRRYAMRVWIDRTALAARRFTANDIEAALNRENVQIPAGRIESQAREFSLNTATGFQTAEDFRNLIIGRGPDGYLVKLADVADVELAAENERTIARTNRISGVSVGIEAQANANALEVAKAVRAEIAALNKDLPAGTQLGINIDRAVFIEASLHEVLVALSISFTLVLVVIYAFLGNWRATLIPAVTIPISILAACAAMNAMGFTLNVLTLLGMVLAIGLVVDDAIVVLENIYRRIEHGEPSLLAAIDGSKEIGFAVIATTLVLSAVFVPISFLGGRVGRLFSEFGFTLAASILFSCLVALTLTPMMTSQLFRGGRDAQPGQRPRGPNLRQPVGVVRACVAADAAALLEGCHLRARGIGRRRGADRHVPERKHSQRRSRRRAHRDQRAGRRVAAVHGWLREAARRHRRRGDEAVRRHPALQRSCAGGRRRRRSGRGESRAVVHRSQRLGRSGAHGR